MSSGLCEINEASVLISETPSLASSVACESAAVHLFVETSGPNASVYILLSRLYLVALLHDTEQSRRNPLIHTVRANHYIKSQKHKIRTEKKKITQHKNAVSE